MTLYPAHLPESHSDEAGLSANEADVAGQRAGVWPGDEDTEADPISLRDDQPVADRLEQAIPVPFDDDVERG